MILIGQTPTTPKPQVYSWATTSCTPPPLVLVLVGLRIGSQIVQMWPWGWGGWDRLDCEYSWGVWPGPESMKTMTYKYVIISHASVFLYICSSNCIYSYMFYNILS